MKYPCPATGSNFGVIDVRKAILNELKVFICKASKAEAMVYYCELLVIKALKALHRGP